jgi:hypothetical protein
MLGILGTSIFPACSLVVMRQYPRGNYSVFIICIIALLVIRDHFPFKKLHRQFQKLIITVKREITLLNSLN